MNALKARKTSNARVHVSGMRTTRMIPQTKLPTFPDNFLVVGAADERGTYVVVVVFGDRGISA